jgi:hypothetical protein
MTYLNVIAAQEKLITLGTHTAETVPNQLALKLLIHGIEERIDTYLGYHAAVTSLNSRVLVNQRGLALLPYYPVQEVNEIEILFPGRPSISVGSFKAASYWLGDRRLKVPYSGCYINCSYKAGYDPLPEIFSDVVLQILTEMLAAMAASELEGGSGGIASALAYLGDRSSFVQSTNLPGGLSQSFALGDAPKAGASNNPLDRILAGTNLGNYLSLLSRYQRRLIT